MNNPIHRQRITKSGWLRKQGGVVRTWHRRWFCLNGDCLFYFAKEDDLRPQGSIFLPGNKVSEVQWTPDDPDKYLLEICPDEDLCKAQKGVPPNQDVIQLCASNSDERLQWIKAIRKVIYSDIGGAIFGQSIEETMMYVHRCGKKIPYLIETSVEFLMEYGLEVEGIFRLPGRTVLIKELKDRFDCAEKIIFNISDHDVHTVASLLKMYFRELPESIIPSSNYQKLMNVAMNFQDAKDDEERMIAVDNAQKAMANIPEDNYYIVRYLCQFLHKVGEKSNVNKMTDLNLATVFGPNIIRNVIEADSPELMMATADLTQQLAFMLINNCHDIFGERKEEEQSKAPEVPVADLLDINDTFEKEDELQPLPPQPAQRFSAKNNKEGYRGSSLLTSVTAELERSGNNYLQPISVSNQIAQKPTVPPKLDIAERNNLNNNIVQESREDVGERKKPIPPARRKKKSPTGGETPPISPHNSLSRSNSSDISEGDIVQDLKSEIEQLKLDNKNTCDNYETKMNDMKAFYEKRIQEIKMSYNQKISVLRTNSDNSEKIYKDQIANLKQNFKGQTEELRKELEKERRDREEAVNKVMELQTELNRYHLQFGQLQ